MSIILKSLSSARIYTKLMHNSSVFGAYVYNSGFLIVLMTMCSYYAVIIINYN